MNVYAISYKHWFSHLYTYSLWLKSLFILKSGVTYIQNSRVLLQDGVWGSIVITFPWDVNLKANWNLDKSRTVQPSTCILYNMSTLVQGQGRAMSPRDNKRHYAIACINILQVCNWNKFANIHKYALLIEIYVYIF